MIGQALAALARRGGLAQTSASHEAIATACAAMTAARGGVPAAVYAGFDPTGPGLHLGHLCVLRALRYCARVGGLRPIVVIGGATAMVGDPTGRSVDRPQLSSEAVAANAAGIAADVATGLGESGVGLTVEDNSRHYADMNVITSLRTVGAHFRLTAMLNKDSVRGRVGWGAAGDDDSSTAATGGGMSFTEFSYQTLQAYDFWRLYTDAGCVMQIGGADQWGNISAGIDYVRRMAPAGASPAVGITVPLVTTADGAKLGKSAGNAIWIAPARTSHHALFQYLLSTRDEDVPRLLALLTDLPDEERDAVVAAHAAAPDAKRGKAALANAVPSALRGPAGLASARTCAAILFPDSSLWADAAGTGAAFAASATADDMRAITAAGVRAISVPTDRVLGAAADVVDLLTASGLAPSKSEARRQLKAGAVSINRARVAPGVRVGAADVVAGGYVLLGVGKRSLAVIQLEAA